MKSPRFFLLILGLTLLAGCFHKDAETDRADDVVANLLYSGPEGQFILSKEEIFQATSKSSGGGVTHISGYTEYRLSAYDVKTGELAGRVVLGEMIEHTNALLGYSPGKVWMFSMDEGVGLHYRDPKTLEVKANWEELAKKPGLGSFKPARPEWPLVDQFFAFDWESKKIMLTDETGYRHQLDPETFALNKTEAKLPRVDWEKEALSNSGEFNSDDTYYLEGDARKIISGKGKKSSEDVSFLFGQFILDQDPFKSAARKNATRLGMQNALQAQKDSLAAFSQAHPEANQEPDWSNWSYEQRRLHDHADDMRRQIEDMERKLKQIDDFGEGLLRYPLLSGDGSSAYVLHASIVADTSHSLLSRVQFHPDTTWSIAWTTHLANFYHDANKADQAGVFETVYSSGNPKFDYTWAGLLDPYLVFISQLRMACVDTRSGKVLWEKEL